MSNQVRIKTDELPPRARLLSPTEASKVFGGCADMCTQDCECCGGMRCLPHGAIINLIPYKICKFG
jgi:hypothetical protein